MGLFIESRFEESEESFRNYCIGVVSSVCDSSPDSLGVRVGKRIEYRGSFFREFQCNAGNGYFSIWMHATRCKSSRVLIRTTRINGELRCYELRDGKEEAFDCDHIRAV